MVKVDDSCMMEGYIGLFGENEDGNYEEEMSFRSIDGVEKYIERLKRALEKYKKKLNNRSKR